MNSGSKRPPQLAKTSSRENPLSGAAEAYRQLCQHRAIRTWSWPRSSTQHCIVTLLLVETPESHLCAAAKQRKQILHFVFLEDGEPSSLVSVDVWDENTNGQLLLCHIVVCGNTAGLSCTAVIVGYHRRVWPKERHRLRTGRGAHATHCARVSFVEVGDVELAQHFPYIVALDERVERGMDLALFLNSLCVDNDLFQFFRIRQVLTV